MMELEKIIDEREIRCPCERQIGEMPSQCFRMSCDCSLLEEVYHRIESGQIEQNITYG